MSGTKIDIVSIGNIIKETIIFPDNKFDGPVLGSPCAYSSLIMAKLGCSVGMVTYFGDDFPKELDVLWQLRLVDKRGFVKHHYSTQNHLIYRADGTKSVEYYKVAPVIEYKDLPKSYLDAKIYYICPMNYEVSIDLCRILEDQGKMLMVDLGGFGGTTAYNRFTIDTSRGEYIIDSLCKSAHIIKVSGEDLEYLTPGLSATEASSEFLERGADIVTITLGDRGSLFHVKGGDLKYVDAFKPRFPEENLDVVGAGDAFAAGFIVKYIESADVEASTIYGNAVASLMIEKTGACTEARMPSADLVELRLDGVI